MPAMKLYHIIYSQYIYSGTCLIRHTKGPGKCVRLYRMSEYSVFILVNRNTLRPYFCDRMSENSGVGLHKFHCLSIFLFFQSLDVLIFDFIIHNKNKIFRFKRRRKKK